jgi:anti-sigma B factor antagonist
MTPIEVEVASPQPAGRVRVLKLRGQIDRSAEEPLLAAYQEASSSGAEAIVLNFDSVEGMDTVGLELLITLLAKAEQQRQRLVACGLSTPLQQALAVSYLDEALEVFDDEAEALQSV